MKASRGVYEYHIVALEKRVLNAFGGYLYGGFLITESEHRNVKLFADYLKLLYRSGTIDVAGYEKGVFALLLVKSCKLTCVSRFTGPLQTDHHNDCGRL